MKRASQISIVHFVNTYSLWVALGSFSTFLFFSKLFGLPYDLWVASGLGLAVWVVYTLDHLLDGIKLKNNALTRRHLEHFSRKRSVLISLALACSTLAYISVHIPSEYYTVVFLLAICTALHFIINFLVSERVKRRFFLKEFFIALVVALGFVLLPVAGLGFKYQPDYILFYILIVFMLNVANLVIFSWYDRDTDVQTNTLSIAAIYSPRAIKWLVYLSLIISFGYSLGLVIGDYLPLWAFTTLVCMKITLLVITSFPQYFGTEDRYRFYGDLIYVYPLLVLPFLS